MHLWTMPSRQALFSNVLKYFKMSHFWKQILLLSSFIGICLSFLMINFNKLNLLCLLTMPNGQVWYSSVRHLLKYFKIGSQAYFWHPLNLYYWNYNFFINSLYIYCCIRNVPNQVGTRIFETLAYNIFCAPCNKNTSMDTKLKI